MSSPQAVPEQIRFASFGPDDFAQALLLDDVDVVVKEMSFTTEFPPNYAEKMQARAGRDANVVHLFVHGWFSPLSNLEEMIDNWWSCGTVKSLEPCDSDGNVPDGDVKEGTRLLGPGMLNDKSKFSAFVKSLGKHGVPKTIFSDLKNLIGIEMHVQAVQDEAREGLQTAPSAKGTSRAPRTVLCTKLHRMPGDKRAAKAKPAAATHAAAAAKARPAAAAAAATAGAELDFDELAVKTMAEAMAATPDGVDLATFKVAANRVMFQGALKLGVIARNKVLEIMLDPMWLESQGFILDGETLKMAA